MSAVRDELHVIFGTGPLGLAVMRALHAHGKHVRVVNRRGRAFGGNVTPHREAIRQTLEWFRGYLEKR